MATKKNNNVEEIIEEETVEETKTEKMVKIKLPLSRTEKDDVPVGVNGRTWLIKRGVEVEVPECVAEVLKHKEEMLDLAMEYEAQASANANK